MEKDEKYFFTDLSSATTKKQKNEINNNIKRIETDIKIFEEKIQDLQEKKYDLTLRL